LLSYAVAGLTSDYQTIQKELPLFFLEHVVIEVESNLYAGPPQVQEAEAESTAHSPTFSELLGPNINSN
jgi:hypothetical protein